jgi:hypothetical protein
MSSSQQGRAEWSGGDFMVIDQVVPPKTITRAHHHRDQSQGAYVVRPPGSVHALWNPGETPARMLELT